MTRQMFRPNVCQVRFCRNSRRFDSSRFDEILHVQVFHFHVSCTLRQTLSKSGSGRTRIEADRLTVAETEELERHRVLERLDAAMARGHEAEHERQEEETALLHQRTQETLTAIRYEAVRVEAARIVRGYGGRLCEERTVLSRQRSGRSSWTRPRTVWTSVRRHASVRLPRNEIERARRAFRE